VIIKDLNRIINPEVFLQVAEAAAAASGMEQLWESVAGVLAPGLGGMGLAAHIRDPKSGDYSTKPLVTSASVCRPPEAAWLDLVLEEGSQRRQEKADGDGTTTWRSAWPLRASGIWFGAMELCSDHPVDPDGQLDRQMGLLAAQLSGALLGLQTRSDLQADKLRAEGILESAPIGLALFDGQGRVIFANATARGLFHDGQPAALGLRGPDAGGRWLASAVQDISQGRQAAANRSLAIEERHYGVWLSPLTGREGGVLGVFRSLEEGFVNGFRELTSAIGNLGDIELLAQSLLKEIQRIVHYDGALLLTREKGEQFRLMASVGLPRSDDPAGQELELSPGLALAAVDETRSIIHTGQAGQATQSLGLKRLEPMLEEARSLVVSPLAKHGNISGLVVLARNGGPGFLTDQLPVIDELCGLLYRTVEHIKSLVNVRRRNQLRDKLYEIGFAAGSVLQVGSLLSLMIRTIAKELRVEEMGIYFYDEVAERWSGKSIMARDQDGGFLGMVKSAGIRLEPERLAEIKEVTAEVIARGLPEIIPNLGDDPRYLAPSPAARLRSGIWVPLKVKDRSIGALAALSVRPNYFGNEDQTLLLEIAPLVTFALRSAMLYEEIRREGSRVGAIINSMPEGLLMLDLDFKVIMSNQSFERQWKLESPVRPGADLVRDIVPQLVERLTDPKPMLDFYQSCATAQSGTVEPVEVELKGRRFLKIISFPVEQPERPHAGLVILHQDITQQRNLEELRQEFVGMLSHDLRNPLSAVIATLDLALDGSLGPLNNDQRQFLGNAMNDSRRMLEMLNDFLDGYKYEAVELKLEKAEFDIGQLVARTIEDFSPLASERQIELSQEEPAVHMVVGDEGKLNRVISNLISNAIKFTPRGGKVTLKVARRPRHTEVSVTDTGEGIAEDEREKIFEKFYQVEKRRLGRKAGTGLGLPLCKKVVEAHGGSIWVESTPGQGSRFAFTIPTDSEKHK
jgi:signal transduction histidine kinase